MIKAALEYLFGLYPPYREEINGVAYTDKQLTAVVEKSAVQIQMHSLQGLADYLNEVEDNIDKNKLFIQVLSPNEVYMHSMLTEATRIRETLIEVIALTQEFSFATFMNTENFIIGLQANFETTELLDQILKILSNVVESNVKQSHDDGVGQIVTGKVGIVRVENQVVPNPIILKPFRTFPEIEQPASKFVLRARDSISAEAPAWALFEADGCQWQLEALERIKNWLDAKVTNKAIKILG